MSGARALAIVAPFLLLAAAFPVAEAHGGESHSSAAPRRTIVSLTQGTFSPATLTVNAGDEIAFKNRDEVVHKLTLAGSAGSGDLRNAEQWIWTPAAEGTFELACAYHRAMKFTAKVLPARPPNHAPVVAITEPVDLAQVGSTVTVRGTLEDEENNIGSLRVRFAGGAWQQLRPMREWTAQFDATRLKDGTYFVEAAAQDQEGAYSKIAVVRVVVGNPDGEGSAGGAASSNDGIVTITSPRAGAEMRGEFVVEGTAKSLGSGLTRVRVRVDAGEWETADGTAGTWRLSLDTAFIPDGPHTVEAQAVNGDDVSASATVRAFVSNADPTRLAVRITTPSSGGTVSGLVGIQGDVGGPDLGAVQVLVRVDGGPWQRAEGANPWAAKWDATYVKPGRHVIEAVARVGDTASEISRVSVEVVEPPVKAQPARSPTRTASSDAEEARETPAPAIAATLAAVALLAALGRRRS